MEEEKELKPKAPRKPRAPRKPKTIQSDAVKKRPINIENIAQTTNQVVETTMPLIEDKPQPTEQRTPPTEQRPHNTEQRTTLIQNKTCISDVEVAKKLINIYQSAQDRKLQFNLSFEYVRKMLEYKTCYYTNKLFTEDGPNARSFDRVDSDKGYVEGNVVACTIDINGKKSNLSFDEIACIYNKLHKKKEKRD
jgi:hypothetical protein